MRKLAVPINKSAFQYMTLYGTNIIQPTKQMSGRIQRNWNLAFEVAHKLDSYQAINFLVSPQQRKIQS